MEAPTPQDVRAALAGLDSRQQKIVIGVFGMLVQHPSRTQDLEWLARQLTEMTLLAGDFEPESADEGVQQVQDYLQEHSAALLSKSFLLFQRVGLDMASRVEEGFDFEDAMRAALDYMPILPPD